MLRIATFPTARAALLSLLIFPLLSACGAPKTPQEVTAVFWQSLVDKNDQQAEKLSLNNTLAPSMRDFVITDFKVERIRIKDDHAKIDTLIWIDESGHTKEVQLITHLTQQDQRWLVDTERTLDSRLPGALHQLFKSLEGVKDGFIESLNKSTQDMEKQLPELEENVKSLGKSLADELDKVLDDILPKIQSAVEDSLNEMDKALEQIEDEQHKNTSPPSREGKPI